VITDRELDRQLAGAAEVDDAALPALPEDFLHLLTEDSVADEPASVFAARQLVADAVAARGPSRSPRRRPGRKVLLRAGTALLALAAAWTTAVLVTAPDGPQAPARGTEAITASPRAGVRLVAAEQITFPLSFDPAPAGLTPTFSQVGGPADRDRPLVYTADYSSDDGDRLLVNVFSTDPRQLSDDGWSVDGDPAGTATVDGTRAEVHRGNGFMDVLWRRGDGRWVRILGEGGYADTAALVAVAESLVDRPQLAGLQFGLAPEGWSVSGYEESRSLDLTNDDDPKQLLRLSVYQPGPGTTIDSLLDGPTFAGPAEPVTIQGRPGRLAIAEGDFGDPDFWYAVGQLPTGQTFVTLAPWVLTKEQVLAIAEQISYRS
jgi:hypothetical protein